MILKKKFTLLLFIILLVLPLSGCCNQNKNNIVIGVAWPFASNNSLFREGVDLAVMQINSKGGVNGRNIRLIKKDDQASVADGMTIAQSFADNRDMVAVIGHRNSFVSLPASRVYQEADLPMISPASTSPQLTQNGYNLVFRSISSDDEIASRLAAYAARQGHKRMVIFYSDDDYGTNLANAFEDHALKNGITTVDRISYYAGDNGMKRLKEKWEALDYDGIFVAEGLPDGAEFIVGARKAGISVPLMGGNALDSNELYQIAGQAAEGTVVGTVFNPNNPSKETQSFIKDFAQQYNKMPNSYAAQGYDAVNLIAAAIQKSGSIKSTDIARELHRLKNWPGVCGYHNFDKNGNDTGVNVVLKIQRNSNFGYIK